MDPSELDGPTVEAVADAAPAASPEETVPAEQVEQPAPVVAATPEVKEPKWYRDEVKRMAREREQLRREQEDMRRRLEAYEAPQQHPQDMGYDPYTYAQHVVQQQAEEQRVMMSEMLYRQQHGDDAFDQLNDWLLDHPEVVQLARSKPNPWAEARKIYDKERLVEEVGTDPIAYRERLKAELMAELQAQAPVPAMNTPPRLPPNSSAQRSAGAATAPTGLTSVRDILGR